MPVMGFEDLVAARDKALAIIERARAESRKKLLEHEAFEVIKLFGIEVPEYCLARTESEVELCFNSIKKPLVAKVVSPDVLHKSDVGGVVLGIYTLEEALNAFRRIKSNLARTAPGARFVGVLYQHMVPKGLEVIIGAKRDVSFGGVVLFGLGGVFVEVFGDVSMRVTPIDICEAIEMTREVKANKLIEGYRGSPPRDRRALAEIILKVSWLIDALPPVSELDLNPVMSYPRGAVAADARIILGEGEGSD